MHPKARPALDPPGAANPHRKLAGSRFLEETLNLR